MLWFPPNSLFINGQQPNFLLCITITPPEDELQQQRENVWINNVILNKPSISKYPSQDAYIFDNSHMYKVLDHRCSSYPINLIVLPEVILRNQHRHLPRRSCLSKVLLREEFVAHLLDERHLTNIVNFNFVLMFDSIGHRFLHAKQNRFCIDGNVLNWIRSYLLG